MNYAFTIGVFHAYVIAFFATASVVVSPLFLIGLAAVGLAILVGAVTS